VRDPPPPHISREVDARGRQPAREAARSPRCQRRPTASRDDAVIDRGPDHYARLPRVPISCCFATRAASPASPRPSRPLARFEPVVAGSDSRTWPAGVRTRARSRPYPAFYVPPRRRRRSRAGARRAARRGFILALIARLRRPRRRRRPLARSSGSSPGSRRRACRRVRGAVRGRVGVLRSARKRGVRDLR
jgi:hypothetical protein